MATSNLGPLPEQRRVGSASLMARGAAAAIGLGIAGSAGLAFSSVLIPAADRLYLPLVIGYGFLISEGVAVAVGRRRGRPYQILALLGVALATSPVWVFANASVANLIGLAGVALAAVVAWRRLRPVASAQSS